MKPIIVNRKPCKCPKCGGKVVKIVYGEPSPELFEMADRKEVVLGGCCIQKEIRSGSAVSVNNSSGRNSIVE